ncbi:glycosyltransferase family 2 protein [Planotetraspora sp. A-T 1434]|uniref:glycosyltransferase n=1 Tax=Planotetraspora sp. A-T 1434 TaxID=2979219 RepID=UPI0021C17791|nr:glycosyltransferase family 2 protein [Planotetraspora sp. A-T 1434]MCT9929886.1 glycosyltransferase family 2 protein [Planotetraspora sp. A-T 1434]
MSGSSPPVSVPLVSVIVPVHNAEKTLRACLRSALGQTYPRIEVVVVDDASTDDSRAIAGELPCALVAQPYNMGVSAARNAGAAASSGEILFFLDSDVGLAPDAVENAVRLLRPPPRSDDPGSSESTWGCVYGVYAKEPLIDDGPVEIYRTLRMHHALVRGAGPTKTAIFALAAVPRAVFEEVGPFDTRLRSAEDDEYSERLLVRHNILLSGEVTGRHDEADRLLPLLREQYRRSQFLLFSARNRLRRDALVINRMSGILTTALTMASVPVALVWPPALPLPAVFLALFAVSDPPLSRFVLREKGPAFLAYFTAVHFLSHAAQLCGAATGWVRATLDSSFGPSHRAALHARPRKAGES